MLPRRFSVGSGFIVCSEPDVPRSVQTDVVLFDEIHNSPLHRELAAFVYPVEMVYGTVEVKGTLTSQRLLKACEDIRKVRELGLHQYYVGYGSVPKDPANPDAQVVGHFEAHQTTPPRAFVFAYEQSSWKTIGALEKTLRRVTSKTGAHVHGLAVLGEDWFLAQQAFTDPPEFRAIEGNALLWFVRGVLHSIASRRIGQASIDRYLQPPAQQKPRSVPTSAPKPSQPRKTRGRRRR